MDIPLLHLDTPGAAGAQFIPLGENSQLLADLAARVHAARIGGA